MICVVEQAQRERDRIEQTFYLFLNIEWRFAEHFISQHSKSRVFKVCRWVVIIYGKGHKYTYDLSFAYWIFEFLVFENYLFV